MKEIEIPGIILDKSLNDEVDMVKKILMVLALVVFSLGMVGATELPLPVEGIYHLKSAKVKSKDINKYFKARILRYKQAQVMETKPETLTVEPEITTSKGIRYGSIRLGNNEKDVRFVMGRDDHDYYSELYVDQNFDNHIAIQEKVPKMDTWEDKEDGLVVHSSSTHPKSVPVMVSFKSMACGEITKKLSFYIQIEYIMKENENDTFWVGFINTSTWEGSMTVTVEPHEEMDSNGKKITINRQQKDLMFRLVDTDSNGCYNDYRKDYMMMDLNEDGKFTDDEAQPLLDSFVVKAKKQKKKLQLLVLPCPGKVAVIEENQDFDLVQLEPESDPLNAPVTDKQNPSKTDKDNED